MRRGGLTLIELIMGLIIACFALSILIVLWNRLNATNRETGEMAQYYLECAHLIEAIKMDAKCALDVRVPPEGDLARGPLVFKIPDAKSGWPSTSNGRITDVIYTFDRSRNQVIRHDGQRQRHFSFLPFRKK